MLPSIDTLAALALVIALVCGCLGLVLRVVRGLRHFDASVLLIGGIGLTAAWLRVFWVPPHHAMYVDEPWYLEAARNLLARGALLLCERSGGEPICTPYPKAAGWPVMLAGAFALFGSGSHIALAVSAFLSTMATLLAALITRLAGGSWHHSIVAALLVAVHPLHVAWSATAETNAAATAILLAGIAGVLLLRRAPSVASATLAAGGLGLAAAMRPELAMALPPALIVLVRGPARPRDVMIVALGGALGATSVIVSWPLYIANSSGTFLSPDNLGPNLMRLLGTNEGGAVSLVIVGLAAVGALVSLRHRAGAVTLLLGGSALLSALVAIGYDRRIFYPRTALGPLVLLTPLAALALPSHRSGKLISVVAATGACVIIVALALPGLRHVRVVSVTQMLQTRLSQGLGATQLPADAVVVAEWPTVVNAETDLIAVAARALADDGALDAFARASADRPHFLLCDMFCEHDPASTTPPACARLLDAFALEDVTSVSDGHRRYGLFRIVGRAEPGSTKPLCPFAHR